MRILVADNDRNVASSIVDYIELQGDYVDYVDRSDVMFELVQNNTYDVIFLDTLMPGKSGFESCKVLREKLFCKVPILLITAQSTLQDKLEGFVSGADDYLAKPFALEELIARARALASRGDRQDIGEKQLLDVRINYQTYQVFRQNNLINLSQTQYKIFCFLVKNYPNVVSKSAIEYEIWGDNLPHSDVLKVQIYQLRKRIDKPFLIPLIRNIRGVGFKLALEK
ncbi:hypothetical protein AB835_04290 [Candidatus Endobugula sertula]|uniref:DNA-binding response regulator n=1 Tax=Candidatus Endobugula sertula TaxID=62101 RepID=A0A1D2QRN6_9GAMM|nr:hypothetical protein AB835_04290 [Candidatus Endobugula sertula]